MHGLIKSKPVRTILAALALVVALAACEDTQPNAQAREAASKDRTYQDLVNGQPAKTMQYSNTRETINKWIERWDEPGKLSYVYLQSTDGTLLGYYILKGLPVSYCVGLTPPYEWVDIPGDGSGVKTTVQAPSVDGAYYGGSGACNTYYGFDATTDAYVEYTAGLGINVLLYDAPLPNRQNVAPLGPTAVEDVPAAAK